MGEWSDESRADLLSAAETQAAHEAGSHGAIFVRRAIIAFVYDHIDADGNAEQYLSFANTDSECQPLAQWETLGMLDFAIHTERINVGPAREDEL